MFLPLYSTTQHFQMQSIQPERTKANREIHSGTAKRNQENRFRLAERERRDIFELDSLHEVPLDEEAQPLLGKRPEASTRQRMTRWMKDLVKSAFGLTKGLGASTAYCKIQTERDEPTEARV